MLEWSGHVLREPAQVELRLVGVEGQAGVEVEEGAEQIILEDVAEDVEEVEGVEEEEEEDVVEEVADHCLIESCAVWAMIPKPFLTLERHLFLFTESLWSYRLRCSDALNSDPFFSMRILLFEFSCQC